MDFFGIGYMEIGLILLVLLIFVGPQRLPDVIRQLSNAYRKLKEATTELNREFREMADEVKDEVMDARKNIDTDLNSASSLATDIKEISNDISSTMKETRSTTGSSTSQQATNSKDKGITPEVTDRAQKTGISKHQPAPDGDEQGGKIGNSTPFEEE